ncbi:TAXI family TRAP transporter solute-binding subunit [Sneathiella marina]|uniref:TAXI family TRAP transporter solute-binding subunit n=1 Tax=Sneathiella marina TaxID=2950108 RepID=A0ABY4W6I0_9PROT|nr:TAXI family TRAP transporter solute-binding subunit [Sneathiella marina]USG62643.1 TAXI family TRAP transporter solute-binding subunit [Sneathiella marina]
MRLKSLLGAGILLAATSMMTGVLAAETMIFRIGTGGISGTYYPVGQAIATMISNPLAKSDCGTLPCGVSGLLAVGQASNGSVANIAGIRSGQIESGFSQSDIAHWARTGTGFYIGDSPDQKIMAIASLYTETIHLAVRQDSGIKSIYDLAGKRVSLDDPGSGTLVDARIILKAYGISETDMDVQYVKASEAIKKMKADKLDAFFVIAGFPSKAISDLSNDIQISLINIDGAAASRITRENEFFSEQTIPAGTYRNVSQVKTLGVGALWIVNKNVDAERAYKITRKFWESLPDFKKSGGHPKLSKISLETAFQSMSVPLHPGAKKYYEENGLLNEKMLRN